MWVNRLTHILRFYNKSWGQAMSLAPSSYKKGSTSIVGVEKKQIISSSVGRIPGTAFMRGKTGCVF